MYSKLSFLTIVLLSFLMSGCAELNLQPLRHFTEKTPQTVIQKSFTVFPSQTQSVHIYENEKDLYFIVYTKFKHNYTEVNALLSGSSEEYLIEKGYKSFKEFQKLHSTLSPLDLQTHTDGSYTYISHKHNTLLFLTTDFWWKELEYSPKKGLQATHNTNVLNYQFEILDYKKTIAAIKETLIAKEFEKTLAYSDPYIKYLIKDLLLETLFLIHEQKTLERFKPLLDAYGILNAPMLFEVQQEHIAIINEYQAIKTKKEQKRFLARTNRIYKVMKEKTPLYDSPHKKGAEVLGYASKGDFFVVQKSTEDMLLTSQAWIDKKNLKAYDKVLQEYKKKAQLLRF
jgi:hypothetical protein